MTVRGEGSPSKTPAPSWTTSVVLPCIRRSARTTVAAEGLPDGLVSEADAEQRDAGGDGGADQRHRDAGFGGRAGTGRDDDRPRCQGHRLVHGQGVVPVHHRRHAKFTDILDDVVGEAVVVVEDQQHGALSSPSRAPWAWRAPVGLRVRRTASAYRWSPCHRTDGIGAHLGHRADGIGARLGGVADRLRHLLDGVGHALVDGADGIGRAHRCCRTCRRRSSSSASAPDSST